MRRENVTLFVWNFVILTAPPVGIIPLGFLRCRHIESELSGGFDFHVMPLH